MLTSNGVPTNWPDRVGAVGRGLLRFGLTIIVCAKKPSSRRSENHCIYRKSFEFNSKCQRAGLWLALPLQIFPLQIDAPLRD